MRKTYYNYGDVEQCCFNIVKQISRDKWVPDMVVGITRGGLLPSVLISNWFDCKLTTLKVSLRRDDDCESNLWLPELATGYVPNDERGESGTMFDPAYRKNILIVDDINDTGATLNWIKMDWEQNCLPNNSVWDSVWNNNVKVATLFNRESSGSEIKVDYTGFSINLDNDPGWIVFPWESWCGE